MASCLDCRFSLPEHMTGDDTIVLECHRFPPDSIVLGDGEPAKLWRQVDADDWCGEHECSPEKWLNDAALKGEHDDD